MPMTKPAKSALEKARDGIHDAVRNLSPDDYGNVLEELLTDIQGRLDALGEEEGDED